MYKNLYDCFKHWYHDDRGVIWLYADTHFGDLEMSEIRKNYISDEEQIKRINSKVGKYDTLIILGDIGDTECVSQLKGYKVLIMGNHDSGASNYIRQQTGTFVKCYDSFDRTWEAELNKEIDWYDIYSEESLVKGYKRYDNHLFDEVYEGPLFISERIVLSHEPLEIPYALNIHGHCHNMLYDMPNHVNVVAEAINYTPVRLSEIIKSGKLKDIESIHRITIDNATEKAKKGKKNKWKK